MMIMFIMIKLEFIIIFMKMSFIFQLIINFLIDYLHSKFTIKEVIFINPLLTIIEFIYFILTTLVLIYSRNF